MVYKKYIFELTTNKLILSKVKLTDMKRFSFFLLIWPLKSASLSLFLVIMLTNLSLCYSSSFLGIPNIANPLVVLDFVHPNIEQFAPGTTAASNRDCKSFL